MNVYNLHTWKVTGRFCSSSPCSCCSCSCGGCGGFQSAVGRIARVSWLTPAHGLMVGHPAVRVWSTGCIGTRVLALLTKINASTSFLGSLSATKIIVYWSASSFPLLTKITKVFLWSPMPSLWTQRPFFPLVTHFSNQQQFGRFISYNFQIRQDLQLLHCWLVGKLVGWLVTTL